MTGAIRNVFAVVRLGMVMVPIQAQSQGMGPTDVLALLHVQWSRAAPPVSSASGDGGSGIGEGVGVDEGDGDGARDVLLVLLPALARVLALGLCTQAKVRRHAARIQSLLSSSHSLEGQVVGEKKARHVSQSILVSDCAIVLWSGN